MTEATAIAEHCEDKLHALRKTQDGVVLSFVCHPNEIPSGVMLADLGTRYMLAMAEIGENDQPKPVESYGVGLDHNGEFKEVKPKREPTLANRIGVLISDPKFQSFLKTKKSDIWNKIIDSNALDIPYPYFVAKYVVREICEVDSLSDIIYDTPKSDIWKTEIYEPYEAWLEKQS